VAEYLKLPEVARRLGISEKTARRMVKGGKLPALFIGNAYRVTEEDLATYLGNAKVDPGKAPRHSSFEPSLFNGIDDEGPAWIVLDAVASAADRLNADAALALFDAIYERVTEEVWETLSDELRRKIIATAEKLFDVVAQSVNRAEDEYREVEARQARERIREWTERISA
jgi:excisionase family DNA binding protein